LAKWVPSNIHLFIKTKLPLDVAKVIANIAGKTCSPSHQLIEEYVFSQSEIQYSIEWKHLKIEFQLCSIAREAIQNDAL
jgi:hypothetical protein